MSKKPAKHSEVRKSKQSSAKRMLKNWGCGRNRQPIIHIRPERILIVTEGMKTEPNYFEGFRKRINANFHGDYVTVDIVGIGDNTMSLLQRAQGIAAAAIDGFTQVWIVYDKDSFPAHDFNMVVKGCERASTESLSYHAAWTNESFELWYLLHFAYTDSSLGRAMYLPKLTTFMEAEGYGRYQKNREDMFDILEPKMSFAIENADKLETANQGKTPANSNPGTTVHHPVRELLPYTKPQQNPMKK